MKLASWPVIFLLVLALLVQNTCLHGFAGKTVFAAKCGHCPSKTGTAPSPDGLQGLSSDHHNPANSPMYVFTMPMTTPTVYLQRLRTPRPTLFNGYKDALPDELLKPPRA
jgi:hypothetical protein